MSLVVNKKCSIIFLLQTYLFLYLNVRLIVGKYIIVKEKKLNECFGNNRNVWVINISRGMFRKLKLAYEIEYQKIVILINSVQLT